MFDAQSSSFSDRDPVLTRRTLLKLLAYGGAEAGIAASLPPDWLPSTLARRAEEPKVVKEMRRLLEGAFEGHEMGLYLSHLNDSRQEEFIISIRPDRLYPVASAFKAAVVLYYFLYTPQEEWQYQQGTPMYSMAVFSSNSATGRVLAEVAKRRGATNPIVAFNDFVMDSQYLKLRYGLFQWTFQEFQIPTNGFTDERFALSRLASSAEMSFTNTVNYSSPAELAQVFRFIAQGEHHPLWQSDAHFRASILACRELLSIPAAQYLSPLERAIVYTEHYSKDGTLRPVDIGTDVRNDAGVWLMEDGGAYLIAFMSVMEGDVSVQTALGQVAEAIRMYQRYLDPNAFITNTQPSAALHPGEFDHGLVRRTGIPIYSAPDLNAPQIPNQVRSTSLFGTTYLMYGAMLRLRALDDQWAEVIEDDKWDEAFQWPIYVRLEDLQIVSRDIAQPLGYVTGADASASKFVILDIYNRQLILIEGTTPILRTPVILNTENTPRDISLMHRGYLCRDMPNYPGVPFTYFLHGSAYLDQAGFAVHGSPWHLWGQTVKQRTLIRRVTHGCINVPDWEIPISYLGTTMRTDEFVFRWAGGFPNPAADTVFFIDDLNPVRVFGLDNMYRDIYTYPRPDSMVAERLSWGDMLDKIDAKELDAPPSFYE